MTSIKSHSTKYSLLIFTLLLLFPLAFSSSTCTCDNQKPNHNTTNEALKYKLVSIASILVGSSLGICLPFLVKNIPSLHPDKELFFLIKAFAAGVILATGFIHILPDAIGNLTSPCLSDKPWRRFPFVGFVAMVAAIGTLMMESFATGYHKRSELVKAQPLNDDDDHGDNIHGVSVENDHDHGHVHGSAVAVDTDNRDSSDLIRRRIVSQVLELGIVVHSVIIGLSLGASQTPTTVKPLVAALSFHQFFEGIGLGGCITQAQFKRRPMIIMILFFSLTTPTGVAIGIVISKSYNENSPTALIVQGLLNSASAGILIYMALVDLLAVDFLNPKMLCKFRLQIGANLALLIGACCMSLMAAWGEH